MSQLQDRIDARLDEIVEIRHDLHRHPELGYEERRTSGLVSAKLTEWGITHRTGVARTGVLAYLPATKPGGQTIALRADMDALPIVEATGKEYTSSNAGIMHACGHDGHTSILLGAAQALSQLERPNDVLLVFQPAEEGGAGGDLMCREGALDGSVLGKPVDMIFGLHGFPNRQLGHVSSRVGPLLASAIELRIEVQGKGGHAAYPHFGIDPIVVAAHIVTALQTVASRSVSPLDSVVVTIGKIEAGVAHNVIPNSAVLRGTLRTLRDETEILAKARIEAIVQHTAEAFGATATVEYIGAAYPVTRNAPETTERFMRVARQAIGEAHVHEEPEPGMGGEDFAFYGLHVPACFYLLGLLPPGQSTSPGLHTPQFDFNDDALPVGIRLMVELAISR